MKRSSRTTWSRPIARVVIREFQRHKVPLQHGSGDADHRGDPQDGASGMRASRSCRACAWRGDPPGHCCRGEGEASWMVDRKIRLVYPARRALSHAAQAFLEVVGG